MGLTISFPNGGHSSLGPRMRGHVPLARCFCAPGPGPRVRIGRCTSGGRAFESSSHWLSLALTGIHWLSLASTGSHWLERWSTRERVTTNEQRWYQGPSLVRSTRSVALAQSSTRRPVGSKLSLPRSLSYLDRAIEPASSIAPRLVKGRDASVLAHREE